MALTRMSSLERWLGCPGFASVSSAEDRKSVNSQVSAAYGTSLHSVKEGLPWTIPDLSYLSTEEHDAVAELQGTVAEDEAHYAWLRERYAGWEHEVHMGYRLDDHRAFRFASDEEKQALTSLQEHASTITGCTDGLRLDKAANRVHVNDLKSGEHPVDLTDAQLLGYGLWGVTYAIQEHDFDPHKISLSLSVLHWPRKGEYRETYMEENGRPADWYARDVPIDELREFRDKLIAAKPLGLLNHLEPGGHCVYCPGALSCPAQRPDYYVSIGKRKHGS